VTKKLPGGKSKMVDYRAILRFDHEGTSQRQISASVGNSRNTVSEVLKASGEKGGDDIEPQLLGTGGILYGAFSTGHVEAEQG